MKKIFLMIGLASLTLTFTSCERDITSLNEDPKHPTEVPSGVLFASAEQALLDQLLTPNVNRNITRFFTQQWSETTYIDETRYDMVARPIPTNHYNRMMASSSATVNSPGVLSALRDARRFLDAEDVSPAQKKNNIAMIELVNVYAWANLVDTFGDIPYFGALKATAENPGNAEIPYDDAKTIYLDLIKRIDAALAMMDTSVRGYDKDLIYKGDMTKWKKMANSLKFRMAVTLSDVEPALAKTYAEAAYSGGLFADKSDNFGLQTFPSGLLSNPVYQDVIQSGRNDFLPSDVLVNYMNSTSDPRRAVWFTLYEGNYVGGKYAKTNTFGLFSHFTDAITNENAQGFLLDYTEIMFLKTEAAARNFNVGDTAANLYKMAIQASVTEYGMDITTADAIIAATPYDATNWKKSVGFQSWVAMFNKGFQAWNFARRLDFPVFVNPSNSRVEAVPIRMKYSQDEYLVNAKYVNAAAAKIGGDKVSTKLFWDKY
ncbi:Susd and RagB outer membrane lipoprotein [Chryseobacterium nakagawai]|uniref:SusD/RagB family nutrient-binding outer membrane lipoprotein n=1 Tax=Chryseobacterium nakagawai TaxID=1241982 RepID=A0AAD1DR20_CHRNA|nr:SusD/RagB family nutrient-binding outer membrane lipoprotein [Chryseobacterium nakagawai]AZA90995.1 SusD/RagB family nutrient-binding outer membrane lipoprotein [Chryseobacterium nakagawai]VEH22543.1 Susd and RagB outer membrane lipoprotein [Chryseobacterium nakagawai]